MKRHSITAIIEKCMRLTAEADRNTNTILNGKSPYLNSEMFCRYYRNIRRAAVNEIIRLQAKEEYADQVERLQQRLSEVDIMEEITQIVNDQESSPASVLGDEMPGTPDYMNEICGSLKPKS